MRKTFEEIRLRAIKKKFVIFPCFCETCKNLISFELMWKVLRYGINETSFPCHYCRKCMPTKQDVLFEIDTDGYLNGIAYVDDYLTYKKKDYTKYESSHAFPKIHYKSSNSHT